MQPQRETTTDRLADVIHVLHIGGKSGMLTVERNENRSLEEGFIKFVNGRVVDAGVSQQNGLIAFNYLNTWGACRYSFVSLTATNNPSVTPTRYPPPGNVSGNKSTSGLQWGQGIRTPPNSGPLPAYNGSTTTPPILPTRLWQGEEALQHSDNGQLPRIHRRLLLLINGQRNVHELARLMARNVDETQKLLEELEQAGLIQQ